MSSEGTGSLISVQESLDLLHKLMTESTKVQAIFNSPVGRVCSMVCGVIMHSPNETLWVRESSEATNAPCLAFDPRLTVERRYGDERSMDGGGETPFGFRFRSVLTFIFEDGSTLGIFEFAE